MVKSTIEKLSLVGVITVDQQEQAMALTKTVGEEIAALIKQQNTLEKAFEALVMQQHELKHQTNRIRKEVQSIVTTHFHQSMICTPGKGISVHTGERGQHEVDF